MSPLNEGYPLPHCFHFGIAKPDHDVCESKLNDDEKEFN